MIIDVESYAKITGKDFSFDVALDQKLYEKERGWVEVQHLLSSDKLLCFDGRFVDVSVVEIIKSNSQLYVFFVEINHLFFVTHHGIVAHNVEIIASTAVLTTLSFTCPPAAIGFAIVQAITAGIVTTGAYFLHKKHKKQKKAKKDCGERGCIVSSGGGGKDPKDNKEGCNAKRPHGLYEDALYHTKNGSGRKSPCPKEGQKCLDRSLSIEGSPHRVGIEGDAFVVFKQTSTGNYHGYVVTWRDIISGGNSHMEAIRKTLVKNNVVTRAGKIIKLLR